MLTNLKHPKILNLVKIPMFYVLQGQWSSKIQRIRPAGPAAMCGQWSSSRSVERISPGPGASEAWQNLHGLGDFRTCVVDKSYLSRLLWMSRCVMC